MAENIIINNSSPRPVAGNSENVGGSSTIETVLKYTIYLVIIALIIGLIVAAYFLIDNWDWVVTSLTTGFIGWLNPFDSPEGDTGPVDTVVEELPWWAGGPLGWLLR